MICRPAHTTYFSNRYVCACCWGELGIDPRGDLAQYFCLKGSERCSGKGFVTRNYAERRRSDSIFELIEVEHNYPQFARPKRIFANEAEILEGLGF